MSDTAFLKDLLEIIPEYSALYEEDNIEDALEKRMLRNNEGTVVELYVFCMRNSSRSPYSFHIQNHVGFVFI